MATEKKTASAESIVIPREGAQSAKKKVRSGGLSALFGLAAYLSSWVAQLVVVAPLFIIVAAAYGNDLFSEEAASGVNDIEIPIGGNMIIYGASVLVSLATIAVFMRFRRISFSDIRVRMSEPKWIAAVFPLFILYFITIALAFVGLELILSQDLLEQEQVTGFEDAAGTTDLIIAFIALVIFAPVSEEVVYRGFLLKAWESRIVKPVLVSVAAVTSFFIASQLGILDTDGASQADIIKGLLITAIPVLGLLVMPQSIFDQAPRWFVLTVGAIMVSALFGVAHGQLNVAVDTFVLSMFMVFLTLKSDSVVPAILMHMLKNGIAYYFLFINPDAFESLS